MIKRTTEIPPVTAPSAEAIRLACLFACYGDSLPFWVQNDGDAFIALADGDITLWGCGDRDELREFLDFVKPNSLFSRLDILNELGYPPPESLWVLSRPADLAGEAAGDPFRSEDVYALLHAGGFALPDYPAFAVDLCRRLNHGGAKVFMKQGKGAAVTLQTGDFALLSGLVSLQKGFGTAAVTAALQQNYGRQMVVCCRENLAGFYQKNGFQKQYLAGSWLRP